MTSPKTLIGATLPDGGVRYVEVGEFSGLWNWAFPNPSRSTNPLDELHRWGAGDERVHGLLSFGNMQKLDANTIALARTPPRTKANKVRPGPARNAPSMRALRASAPTLGAELLAVYDSGTWAGWLMAPNGAASDIGALAVRAEQGLALVRRAGEAFDQAERVPAGRGRQLRAAARRDAREASRLLGSCTHGDAVKLLRWRGIVLETKWGDDLWTAEGRGTSRPKAIGALGRAVEAVALTIAEMRTLHDEILRSEQRDPLWTWTPGQHVN